MQLTHLLKKPNCKEEKNPSELEIVLLDRDAAMTGMMKKCNVCKAGVLADSILENAYICPKCGNYFSIPAMRRIEMIADEGSFKEWDTGLVSGNPLHYKGYEDKILSLREKTGLDEAVVCTSVSIGGVRTAVGVCDSRFMMGSMGKVVGEKITRLIERATESQMPIVIFTCSGGARMQEGIYSLMQMAKTSAALKRHHEAGLPYITVLTNPTTGGVTASFAMLGDIILAEPEALIGFAGPRVIEQTTGQKLPKGFQKSEFLLEHGFVDKIVKRHELKAVLEQILSMHSFRMRLTNMEAETNTVAAEAYDFSKKITRTPWERVLLARKKNRPIASDFIHALLTDFIELHGDRYYMDDGAIIGGIARFHGMAVTVIAQEKGRGTKGALKHNFGMASPEGYRKALRLMKQAEKFSRPVICFVDTPGAFCGMGAEERGQGEAIGKNLFEMSNLSVPIVSIVIGEGGSGGALALAVADEVWILENAIYSVLSPEGFASILWKDGKRAKEAAGLMRLTAEDLKNAGIVERVFEEPEIYTVETMQPLIEKLDRALEAFFIEKCNMDSERLIQERYERFRKM